MLSSSAASRASSRSASGRALRGRYHRYSKGYAPDLSLARLQYAADRISKIAYSPQTRDNLCRIVHMIGLTMSLALLITESTYTAITHEAAARDSQSIRLPVYGLQATRLQAPDLINLSIGESNEIGSAATRSYVIDNVHLHPVGRVLLEVVRAHGISSLVDYPCKQHRDIIPGVLKLARSTSNVPHDSAGPNLQYYCLDDSRKSLSQTRETLNEVLGPDPSMHYVLQETPGSFLFKRNVNGESRITAGTTSLSAASDRVPVLETVQPFANKNYVALSHSGHGPLAGSSEGTKSAPVTAASAEKRKGGELVFSWCGRQGGHNATTEVRELVLAARVANAQLALIGAHAAYGTKWELPPASAASIQNLSTGQFTGPKMPYFPFGDAVVSITAAYSPSTEEDGMDATKFLVLYRLDALPKVLVQDHAIREADALGLQASERQELDIAKPGGLRRMSNTWGRGSHHKRNRGSSSIHHMTFR